MADEQDIKSQREEFAAARRALVDKIVAGNPGLSHQDFNDVKVADFDTHTVTLVEQRTAADREAAARALGVPVDQLDEVKAKLASGEGSTPQERTAHLPTGKPTLATPVVTPAVDATPRTGLDSIEAQAREDIAIWQSTGKWPARKSDTFS